MITSGQMRAARMLLALDQRALAARAGVSVPTIQRMEASAGIVRGNSSSLTRVIAALQNAGVELIGENAESHACGRGVRLVLAAEREEISSATHSRAQARMPS
ncbi:MAG: helix-turn-helix transcriptional regulator [Alphaproteobacteria bacterium]|nr:helix-turn-helix transcriptional regulator [Alphaproteobacteria bacterium]MBV9693077.1 helix-turn-helix transcriptional regulator [Alphaproteobacteria bacterium]